MTSLNMRKGLKSVENRMKEGMGSLERHGADYKPFMKSREFSSYGFCENIINPYTKRSMHLFSHGEAWATWEFIWDDNVKDIREQVLLDKALVDSTTDLLGYPRYTGDPLTADLCVTYIDGTMRVFQVKESRAEIVASISDQRRIITEAAYWKTKGISFNLLYREDMDPYVAENISEIMEFYDDTCILDDFQLLKHLMAQKIIAVDIYHGRIDFGRLIPQYREELDRYEYLKTRFNY